MSKNAINWIAPVMLVFFLLGVGQKASHVYYKDNLVRLSALLVLIVVTGYIWQCFTVPEALLGDSIAKRYITAFCLFVVVAYGMNVTPKVSPFLLLISAGVGLFVHLTTLSTDIWVAAWQGERVDLGLKNAQHAGVVFGVALLASMFFLPRVSLLPFRARMLALPLLGCFILLMIFGVIATQTRAVWLGLAFSAVILPLFFAVILLIWRRSVHWRALAHAAAIGTGILLLASMMLYSMVGSITQRLSEETVDATTITKMARSETISNSSIGVRIGLWSVACEWIAERPVFGWGRRAASKLIKQSPHFNEEFKKKYTHVHNSYLETIVGVGAAAIACMIAIILLVAWRTTVLWRRREMPTDVFFFSCAVFSFWIIVNIFESYVILNFGTFLNTVIGGFVYSWYLRRKRETS
ncbi:MAG: O-antigen ligase family protein [Azoarcus sp.]|nr:O-antigen ligase family protein [Azoarcus sp.]